VKAGALRLAILAAAYYGSHRLGYLFLDPVARVSPVWPATGLAVAFLLLSQPARWPAITAVVAAANLLSNLPATGYSLPLSAGFLAANLVEIGLAAWAITRFGGPAVTFARVADVLVLIGVATLGTAASAVAGAATVALVTGAPFWTSHLTWWTSELLGILLVTPLVVTWARSAAPATGRGWRRAVEASVILLVWGAAAWAIYFPHGGEASFAVYPYLHVALIVWVALRLGPRGVAAAMVVLAAAAVYGAARSEGAPFALEGPTRRLLQVQLYLATTAVTGLLLAASVAEAGRSASASQAAARQLRLALDSARMGVWEWDVGTGGVRWSEQVEPMFGLPAGVFRGTFDADLALVHPTTGTRSAARSTPPSATPATTTPSSTG
jgi:integral membrane sensor domain MASE1